MSSQLFADLELATPPLILILIFVSWNGISNLFTSSLNDAQKVALAGGNLDEAIALRGADAGLGSLRGMV